ncbi:MAG: VOC family protein [Gemmataceae bacterium]
MGVHWQAPGYHSVTPYLIVTGAPAAIAFYQKALGAVEVLCLKMPDGTVAHAEIKIGDSHLMLGEDNPQWNTKSPATLGGSPCGFLVYVPNADEAFAHAVSCGCTVEKPVENQFWGDRCGSVIDPFGHKWTIATRIEDVTPEMMHERMQAWIASAHT